MVINLYRVTYMTSTEKPTQQAILEYLVYRGHFVWRNNSGGFKVQDRYIKAGRKGSSDIIGCSSEGKLIAVEVKDKKGRLTAEQETFLDQIKQRGGYAILAYTLDDVINSGL
jgi:VRR-NUC domain-containing protein